MKQQILWTGAAAMALIFGSFIIAIAQTSDESNLGMQQPATATIPSTNPTARVARGRAGRNATRASTGPNTRPAASPARGSARAAAPASRRAILPAEFAILNSQNPFAKSGGAAGRSGARGASTGAGGGPEATIFFSGSILIDSKFTAFLEDSVSKKTMKMAVGDSVARGQISAIDLDSLTYEMDGNSQRVMVGQNLLGQSPPPPATQPSGPQQAGVAPPGSPAAAAAARRGAAAARGRAGVAAPGPQPGPPDVNQ